MESKTFVSLHDTAMDKNLSFQEKILSRFEEKRKEAGANPRILNKYSPYLFVAEVVGVWYYGTYHAVPFLYSGYGGVTVSLIQAVIGFLTFEVVINWWCVYTVDSNYDPQRHGTQLQETQSLIQVVTDKDCQIKRREANSTGNDSTSGHYWAWQYCTLCDQPRPPRCHHCMLCNRCSLKRDHHCFFARNCVGYRNFRHFIVMVFWAFLSSVMGFVHALAFILLDVLPPAGYVDLLPFVAFFRWIFGYSHFRVGILVLGIWFLVMFIVLTTSMILDIPRWISDGKTSYEVDNKIPMDDTRHFGGKLRAVFGKYWLLNFLVPLHWLYQPEEDPVHWPTINR